MAVGVPFLLAISIEVSFSGTKDAVGRLFALAQALTNDYERFEKLVEGENAAGGGGEVRE